MQCYDKLLLQSDDTETTPVTEGGVVQANEQNPSTTTSIPKMHRIRERQFERLLQEFYSMREGQDQMYCIPVGFLRIQCGKQLEINPFETLEGFSPST